MNRNATSRHQAPLSARSRAAVATGRVATTVSRKIGSGSGSMIGGRVALALDPRVLSSLSKSRTVVLVSATNGKTTTTRMIAAAVSASGPVVSNSIGANMASGHVATLLDAGPHDTAVLEVDEHWLPEVMTATQAEVVVLLNLSHDQLDRTHEVRNIAVLWRDALKANPPPHIIANADDPLITWAASGIDGVHWVGTGSHTENDVVGCPECRSRLSFTTQGWHCENCGLHRPDPEVWLEGTAVLGTASIDEPESTSSPETLASLDLNLPGHVNYVNATMAIAATQALGLSPRHSSEQFKSLSDIAGRYRVAEFSGSHVRLILAKNPSGWKQAIAMLAPAPQPVIISINAQTGDGKDTSWLWDVPFETLGDRPVIALGERCTDLAVRFSYAEIDFEIADNLHDAVNSLATDDLDLVANYTAFQAHLKEVSGANQFGVR